MAIEIIATPLEVYIAATGTTFPKIQEAPGSAWTLIGTNGTRNMSEEGVTISHPQEFFEVKVAGSTVTQKVYRTSEGLTVGFTLYDLKAEEYSNIMNYNTVTSTAAASGVAAQKEVNLYRGITVPVRALLLRGKTSPEQDGANAQFEIPQVYQAGSPEVVFTKGEASGLAFEFMALFDNTATGGKGLGVYRYQTADAQ